MTSSCHLTKAPEMKYIDWCYQSQPTHSSYRSGGPGVGDRFACGHQMMSFNCKISIGASRALAHFLYFKRLRGAGG